MSLKKYLYVFRPLLACRWIERQLGQVPMLFVQLVESMLDEADVRAALTELVTRKQSMKHSSRSPRAIECQRADLEVAKTRLAYAFKFAPKLRLMALEDEDRDALSIGGSRWRQDRIQARLTLTFLSA